MNRSKSKYFNTALRMNESLIEMLEEKELEYITVKEICQRAGVNRSTFYLHYETIADLVNETAETIDRRFLSYFPQDRRALKDSPDRKDLVLVSREYLLPYLRFIQENKKVYRAAFKNPGGMQTDARYRKLRQYVLEPIMERFEIPDPHRPYYIAYYVEGVFAIVKEWLGRDCADEVETVIEIILACVRPKDGYEL